MSAVPPAAGVAASAAAVIAEAIKASGAIVRVEPDAFTTILAKSDSPLVVAAEGGWLSRKYQYLTGYRGLVFFCQAPQPLSLPGKVELIAARKIWIPG